MVLPIWDLLYSHQFYIQTWIWKVFPSTPCPKNTTLPATATTSNPSLMWKSIWKGIWYVSIGHVYQVMISKRWSDPVTTLSFYSNPVLVFLFSFWCFMYLFYFFLTFFRQINSPLYPSHWRSEWISGFHFWRPHIQYELLLIGLWFISETSEKFWCEGCTHVRVMTQWVCVRVQGGTDWSFTFQALYNFLDHLFFLICSEALI